MPVAVCANLPYYITSPIIMKLLEDRPARPEQHRHGPEGGRRAAGRLARHPGQRRSELCGALFRPAQK